MRDGLRNLYSVIKDADAHIRFAFLTGVSKFSKVSLFSGLNNLQRHHRRSRVFGHLRLHRGGPGQVFAPELDGLDRDADPRLVQRLQLDRRGGLQPLRCAAAVQKRQFRPWWFETATPTFLVDLLTERRGLAAAARAAAQSDGPAVAFDVEHIATEALLFQTGYLTIDSSEERRFDRVSATGCAIRTGGLPEPQQRLLEGLDPDGQADAAPDRAPVRPAAGQRLRRHGGAVHRLLRQHPHDWYRNNPSPATRATTPASSTPTSPPWGWT
jgi:hypothetical protein